MVPAWLQALSYTFLIGGLVSAMLVLYDILNGHPQALSLSAFEVGLFGWMLLMRFVFFPHHPLHPKDPAYWFLMQVGMMLGFATAFPVNWLLLERGWKEAM